MCAFWNYLVKNPDVITMLLVIIGWAVVHFSSKSRDFKNKQREMKVSYLVGAYRQLKGAYASRDKDAFIRAIDDIQLFGSKDTLTLLQKNLNWYINENTGKYFPRALLKSLRADLRNELKIKLTDEDLIFLSKDAEKIMKISDFDDITKGVE